MSDNPAFAAAFVKVVADGRYSICEICGLGQLGHTPESSWLGYEPHPWQPVAATAAQLVRSGELTVEAYRARQEQQR